MVHLAYLKFTDEEFEISGCFSGKTSSKPFFIFTCTNNVNLISFVRPKWPASSFISTDGLITAMAYRLPHVVCTMPLDDISVWF